MAGVSIVYSQVLADFDVTAWGAVDWAFWGSGSPGTNVVPSQRKSGGGSTVGNYTCTVATLDFSGGAAAFNFTWTGGTPTASGSSKDLLYNTLNGGGSSTTGADGSTTLPADTTPRVGFLLLDAYNSTVTITATLSDGSAGPAVNAVQVNNPYNGGGNLYEITYSAAGAGQTLTLRAVAASNGGFSDVEPRAAGWKFASAGTSLTPGQAALTLTGQTPTVARTANVALSPAQKAVTLTGFAPTVAQSAGTALTPGQAAVTIAGQVPTVARTANQSLRPGQAALTIVGRAPTVVQASGSVNLTPGRTVIGVQGHAPTLRQTGGDPYPLGSGGGPAYQFESQASIRARARQEKTEQWVREEQAITERLTPKRKAVPAKVAAVDSFSPEPPVVVIAIPKKKDDERAILHALMLLDM